MTIREYTMENGRLIFSYPGIAAAQMNDPIVLTVKDADQVVHTGKYSVRQYADNILNGSYDCNEMICQIRTEEILQTDEQRN